MRAVYPHLNKLTALLAIGLVGIGLQAHAADTDSDDPPDRVARLSLISGDVLLQPAGTQDWAPASLNRPLTTDDQLWVEKNARAELTTDSATIHLDESTAFSFMELSDAVLQIRLTSGALHINVRRMRDGEIIEIDTPQSAVTVNRPGDYHVEVDEDAGNTLVKTYHGQAEVIAKDESLKLNDGEQTYVNQDHPPTTRERLAARSEFDSWAQGRNAKLARTSSASYVAPDVVGYEDLDEYGSWVREPEYGYVWYPTRVVVGWSPYRYGHWAWIAPWGWTWVDDAPWGFAPFHYGRWAYVRSRWCWVPGPIGVRAVYAPALVAWVGGPHVSFSVSVSPTFGWFPLAPHDIFVPSYYASRRYYRNVNYANTVIVNVTYMNRAYVNRSAQLTYRNRSVHNAITVTSRESFANARPIGNHIAHVQERELRNWQVHNAGPAVAPVRSSTLGPRWSADSNIQPRHDRFERSVVTRRAPPTRATFEAEQRAVRENANRPIPRRELFATTPESEHAPRRDNYFEDRPRRLYDSSLEQSTPGSANRDSRTPTDRQQQRRNEPPQRPELQRDRRSPDNADSPARNETRNMERSVERSRESNWQERPAPSPQRSTERSMERSIERTPQRSSGPSEPQFAPQRAQQPERSRYEAPSQRRYEPRPNDSSRYDGPSRSQQPSSSQSSSQSDTPQPKREFNRQKER